MAIESEQKPERSVIQWYGEGWKAQGSTAHPDGERRGDNRKKAGLDSKPIDLTADQKQYSIFSFAGSQPKN